MSGIAATLNDMVRLDRARTRFDNIFNSELNTYFKDGLIRYVDSICRACYRQLLLKNAQKKNRKIIFFKCKISNPNGLPRLIDVAIGTRVSCTRNLGTQIGTFNLLFNNMNVNFT